MAHQHWLTETLTGLAHHSITRFSTLSVGILWLPAISAAQVLHPDLRISCENYLFGPARPSQYLILCNVAHDLV